MTGQELLPRNALVWIIISQFALLAPHLARLPVWVVLVYLMAACWRTMVHQGRWSYPRRWVKLGLILAGFGAIVTSYGNLLGLEPMVALLLTAFALKLLELVQRKDAYVLLFLGYFICVTSFLFSQDIVLVLYSLFTVVLVTTALVALHQPGEHRFRPGTIRLPAIMLAQAFPLMLVLFFLFPRIGPLWTVPVKSHAAKTGVSDFMKPGDISSLSQSGEMAFTVQFDGPIPAQSALYWRGLVFSVLEEGAWRSLRRSEIPAAETRPSIPDKADETPLAYSVLMTPTRQNWLYSLRYAESSQSGLLSSADFRLFTPVEIEDQFRYRARSWLAAPLDTQLSSWRRRAELALPEGENPRSVQLARDMRAASNSDADFVDAVLGWFNRESFVYTLQPPLLGQNPMDQFLFQTRRGFCEHYAYAFVLMMRAAGVPARVVAGYQGGEVNPVNRTVIVRQFDAHAWAEVWLPGQGWVRIDPTGSVAPERIEFGLEQALVTEGSFMASSPLSLLRYRGVGWVNMLRLRYEALTYRWQSWVVGFNSERQYQLLEDLFGGIRARTFVIVFLVSGALVLAPVAWLLLGRRQQRRANATQQCYLDFCTLLARRGLPRDPGEAPASFAGRVALENPALAGWTHQFTRDFNDLAYAHDGLAAGEYRRLLAALRAQLRQIP